MNILILSTGGGGGNILRSVKTLFERDVAVTHTADPAYAGRLRSAISTCFLDTNEFSLSDVPAGERLLIGATTSAGLGARHNPDVARQALEESRADVEALMSRHGAVIVIGTGGKGTGAGTIFPIAQMARRQKKLVIPIFVRPSFERHEVDKRRYDHALAVGQQFDAAGIRLVEILNDRGYDEADPQPQPVVWERMNLPIARALRGLLYVLWDLSQVDPSDLSTLFAGPGRLRIGFGGIDCADGLEPTDEQLRQAVRECWGNPYSAFDKPAGTSLICIQGEWSNIADARIKGGLAGAAMETGTGSPYNPLYTRAARSPKPWGVTGLFAEYTGVHAPIDIAWSVGERPTLTLHDSRVVQAQTPAEGEAPAGVVVAAEPQAAAADSEQEAPAAKAFATFWEFAVAVNRSEPAALAIAGDGADAAIPVEAGEVRKLLGTVWFRTVAPRLSEQWKTRVLDAFVNGTVVPNHQVRSDRHLVHLSDLSYRQLQELSGKLSVPDAVRPDLDLLVAVGRVWGDAALARVRFGDVPRHREPSRFGSLLEGLRS